VTDSHQECIICNAEPRYVIEETDLSIATYFPRAIKEGHFVVATKQHLPTLTDISEEQGADVAALSVRLARRAKEILGAEKFYAAVIGDKDAHYHVHMFPKMAGDPPLGKHIMLDEGWKGEVGSAVTEDAVEAFIRSMRNA
jgi:diadenosine tetraphosphate (Ap4A) HIT family hydrolase